MKRCLLAFSIMFSFLSFAQLTEHELQEVTVKDSLRHGFEKILVMRRAAIQELQVDDAGQLLQKFAGIAVRSYGGLGGLKTVSVRGLGSQHTAFVIDGFPVANTQTGQLNLGQIQTENIESIQLLTGGQKNYLVPSSAQVSGSVVLIETFENSFSSKKNQLRVSNKMGSFGQFDSYIGYKYARKKILLSTSGNYKQANGNYPFSIKNGTTPYSGVRSSNKYMDWQTGAYFAWRPTERNELKASWKINQIDQELPGVVILYAQPSKQNLFTQNNHSQLAYSHRFDHLYIRIFSSYLANKMSYSDSSGQAMGGLINMHYNNHLLQSGINFLYLVNTKLGIYFNTEEQISHLSTNSAQIAIPNRYHNFSVLGFNWYNEIGKIAAQLSSQYVEEENSFIKRTPVLRFNPFLSFETKEYGKKMKLQFNTFYRNSFRMPSFSELYYNSIGNINLKPEDANQLSLGYLWNFKWNKIQLMQRGNAYFNQVRNKIIAIPTKNLFIWSMQNIGKVNVFGIDESLELNYSFSSNWSAFFNLNYTYQAALDITDKESPTFKNQVAYIPKHTGNMDLTLKRKNSGLRVSSFMSSFKYALNENVQSNQIDGYATLDLAVFTALKFKMNELRIQLTCKNCTNTSYAVVRYYVMPGRSYLITLNYALK